MRCRILLTLLVLLSIHLENVHGKAQKVVSTLLNAKWRETDMIAEAMEFLDPLAFWEYLEHSEALNREALSDKDLYDNFMEFASRYMPWTQLNMLKLSLSLRIESPKVETFQQIATDRGVASLDCPAVIETASGLSCDLPTSFPKSENGIQPELLKIDHIYPHDNVNAPEIVILYGLASNPETFKLHQACKKLASQGEIRYAFRPYLHERPQNKVRLSGYGVELQIKSTEYKAQDDRKVQGDDEEALDDNSSSHEGNEREVINGIDFKKLESQFPDSKEKLDEFKQHLKDQNNDMAPMKVWQLQDLSMQASERIMNTPSKDQLSVLTDIAQNFPSHARSLSRVKVPKDLKKEIIKNSEAFANNMNLQPSDAALFVNGIFFDMDYADIFTIFDSLKTEGKILDGLGKLGLSEDQANKLISLDLKGDNQQSYGIDIRDSSVKWINDIEKDKMYVGWPKSVDELLRPTFPGMLRSIRRNFFNVVIMFDPTDVAISAPLLRLLESFYVHSTPLRIGLVFYVNEDPIVSGLEDPGVAVFEAFNYIAEAKSNYEALSFLTDLYTKVGQNDKDSLDADFIFKELKSSMGADDKDAIFGEDSDYSVGRVSSKRFILRSGFKSFPQMLMNGVPLESKNLNAEDLEETIMRFIMRETNKLQKAVYHRELQDNQDVTDYLMDLPHIMPRLSDRVLKVGDDDHQKNILDMSSGDNSITDLNLNTFGPYDVPSKIAVMTNNLNYVTYKDDYKLVPLTFWIIADLETVKGRELLKNAVAHAKLSKQIRIGLITNNAKGVGMITRSAQLAFEKLENSALKTLLSKIMKEETVKSLISGKKTLRNFDIPGAEMGEFADIIEKRPKEQIFELHSMFSAEVLGFKPGENGVVVNGRIIGPFDSNEIFDSDDFNLLEKFSMSQFGDKLVHSLYEVMNVGESSGKIISDKAMRISSLLISRPPGKSRTKVTPASDKKSVIKIEPNDPKLPSFDIVAITDPVSRGAQKLSSIISVLSKVLNCRIRIFLNAVDKHSEMPQNSYFRTVLEPEIYFDSITGKRSSGPVARFSQLPEKPIFTMHYHISDNWLVEPVKSIYDMDNIKLENIDSNIIHSEYELEHLLVEGHCFEALTGNSPRGLQLTLGTRKTPLLVDTIVMANLGYLQLKGNPGRWIMKIREGRSKDLYDIVSQDGGESLEDNTVQVLVTSFQSTIIKLKVSKKPGKQNEELLAATDNDKAEGGIWNSITSTFTGNNKEGNSSADEDENKLNIFCLASGHLYERLLKIMMLSTIRNTKAKVKFWILKGYLSPSLKDFLPEYARRYGFEYEYVQYKWPRWLNQQKEKQRIIWGYKILFLDVMFPLDVKKIIFVDTDQIVRADLTELRDMDLGGAPYGYTPFCDSNKDMDGFRFWKSGYWKNHLAGRAYHISALYVVDLVKFRQIAAGDRLRGQYQALSQDPNSLANLDQDLPNNMIHQVPIKSLPQEWLYCETWCAKETLKNAKSIDLCNNPLTKESKLDAARRIVKEWPQLDEEMQKLTEEIAQKKKKQQKSHDHTEL